MEPRPKVRTKKQKGHTHNALWPLPLQHWGGRTRTYNFLINSQAVCQLTYAPSIVPRPSNKKARLYLAGRVFISKRVLARSPPGAPIIQAIEIIGTRHHATNLQSGIQPRQPRSHRSSAL